MPLFSPWRRLEVLPPRRGRDAQPGIYELADEHKNLIYIGQSAKDAPNRIRQHLAKNSCIKEKGVYWRALYSRVPQADEAKHINLYLQKHGTLPRCNAATPKLRDLQRRYGERSRTS